MSGSDRIPGISQADYDEWKKLVRPEWDPALVNSRKIRNFSPETVGRAHARSFTIFGRTFYAGTFRYVEKGK